MFTSRHFFVGLADPWSTSIQNLERTSRPLKAAGLWPQGTRGRGPIGEGVKAPHLAALVLAQARHQPSDAFEVYEALAPLRAEAAKPLKNPGAMEDFGPAPGERLATYIARLIDRLARTDSVLLATVEAVAEQGCWTLTLTTSPAAAFVEWQYAGRPRRINFLPVQPTLLAEATPRRLCTFTAVPFHAICAAAQLQAASLGAGQKPQISEQAQIAPSENENAASSARKKAAHSSFEPASTAEPGQSAPNKNRKYPISRKPRKRHESGSVARPALEFAPCLRSPNISAAR